MVHLESGKKEVELSLLYVIGFQSNFKWFLTFFYIMCLSKFKKWVSKEKEEKSHWQNVLLALYTDATRRKICEKRDEVSWDEHPLTKKLKISGEELSRSISFLKEQGFIKQVNLEHVKEAPTWFKIEEKGVNVAIEIKRHRYSGRTQLTMAYLTTILAVTVIFQLFHELEVTWPRGEPFFTDNILFVAFIIIAYVVFFEFRRLFKQFD